VAVVAQLRDWRSHDAWLPSERFLASWGIASSSADESVVEIEIVPTSKGCNLTLTHRMDPKWAEYSDRMRTGWTTMLNALGRFFNEEQ